MKLTLTKIFNLLLAVVLLLPASFLPQHVASAQTGDTSDPTALTAAPILRVPADVSDLQSAINQIPNGGIIEMADGIYPAPYNGLGFVIHNLKKAFTIRAAQGATVILDGGGNRQILHFVNTDLTSGGWVTFEGITFANGYSGIDGLAGGVTMQKAQATFVNSVFRNNVSKPPWTGAGGIVVSIYSTAFFFDCVWRDNIAKNYGAGLVVQESATAYVHNSLFSNNRTNDAGHANWAAGGGIHVGNSKLRVSNTRFEYNQAGYVGGAIYARGDWRDPASVPSADVIIANSTFYQNRAVPNGVQLPGPTEGGAVHIEDQAYARIYNSRFILNSADTGGGLNLYRSKVEVYDGVFLGNRAVGVGNETGFGGAISVLSNDVPEDGNINRPPSHITVVDTYIQGRYGGVTTVGQAGGGMHIAGDKKRLYGILGVSQMGTAADNRVVAVLKNVVIYDTDIVGSQSGIPGNGGGIMTDITDLTMDSVLILNADAVGNNAASSGGGACIINQSNALVKNSTVAYSTVGVFGGGLFFQGSNANVQSSFLFGNEVSPGVAEPVDTSYGAAIFSSPDTGFRINVTGSINNTIISENIGLPIYDDDRTNGPINDLRYNSNQIYSAIFTNEVYSLGGVSGDYWRLNIDQFNTAVVVRNNGTVTDKVQVNNSAVATPPKLGAFQVVPSQILPVNAYGDHTLPNPAYLVYAWAGSSSASLDGVSLTAKSGAAATNIAGVHTLNVSGQTYQDSLTMGVVPQATLTGNTTQLTWNVTQGTFLEGAMDQGIVISSTPSGTVSSGIAPDRIYRYYAITKEGGAVATLNISNPLLAVSATNLFLAGLNREHNLGSISVSNIGGSTLNWIASTTTPWIQLLETSGSTTDRDSVVFSMKIDGFSPGTYSANISINAGDAGSQNIQLNVVVVDILYDASLPLVKR